MLHEDCFSLLQVDSNIVHTTTNPLANSVTKGQMVGWIRVVGNVFQKTYVTRARTCYSQTQLFAQGR